MSEEEGKAFVLNAETGYLGLELTQPKQEEKPEEEKPDGRLQQI